MGKKKHIPKLRFREFYGEWEEKALIDFSKVNPTSDKIPEWFYYIDLESVTRGNLIEPRFISKNEAPSRAQRLLRQHDILFQTVRPYQQNNYFYSNSATNYVASTGYAVLRTNYNPLFLYYYIHTCKFVNSVLLKCTGTSYPSVNTSDLSATLISHPTLPEQKKIADFLSAIDERIQYLTKKKELLEQYKRGVMQKIFLQKFSFKDESGKPFPKWEKRKLINVSEIVSGGTPDTSVSEYWNGEINWFTPTEIKEKYLTDSRRKITSIGLQNSNAKLLPQGTVVFTSRASVGDVGILVKDATTNQGFQSFLPNKLIHNEFLYYWLIAFKNIFLKHASGSTFLEISKTVLSNMVISLPSLPEQKKIADFLTAIDNKIEHVTRQLEKTSEYKKGLLQQMFV